MLAIIAVLCPPVAVALVGRPSQAIANVGLTMLLFVPGIIHAMSVVDRYHTEQRNETLMQIASRYYA
jgi:uncharacterized membrane protein YqaE (UPF0057 family)